MDDLKKLTNLWNEKLRLGLDHKKKVFQDDADECLRFYEGPHDFMFHKNYRGSKSQPVRVSDTMVKSDYSDADMRLDFRVTANKCAEMVQLFGPYLYHQNPTRRVSVRKVPIPPPRLFGVSEQPPMPQNPAQMDDPNMQRQVMMEVQARQRYDQTVDQQNEVDIIKEYRAQLLEYYLNYTPNELGLAENSRKAIDETLIKGRGIVLTEYFTPHQGGPKMVGSFHHSVDDLVVDPDAESPADWQWAAMRCVAPKWQILRDYPVDEKDLEGHMAGLRESSHATATANTSDVGNTHRKLGETSDMVVYWKIWSRMGIGCRLKSKETHTEYALDQMFGDNVYLVIVPGMEYPLNLSPQFVNQTLQTDPDALPLAVSWPIPFYIDRVHPWPFTPLDFHWRPRCAWPIAHMTFAIGYQKFLNWAYSMIASKVIRTCRDLILVANEYAEQIKKQIENGRDLEVVVIGNAPNPLSSEFKNMVQLLQYQPMNSDVYTVLSIIDAQFEKATGLMPVMYGTTPQAMRSAEEANLKGETAKLRPEDMANKTEEWASLVARKEAIAAIWGLSVEDVRPILGDMGAEAWSYFVTNKDFAAVTREYDYRVEEGSARRPSPEKNMADTNEAMQFLFTPAMQHYAATGDSSLVNNLLGDWAKARGNDPSRYMMPSMPPPPPPGGTNGANGSGQ